MARTAAGSTSDGAGIDGSLDALDAGLGVAGAGADCDADDCDAVGDGESTAPVVALAVGSVDAAGDVTLEAVALGPGDVPDAARLAGFPSLHPDIKATDTKTVRALRKVRMVRDG